MNHKPHLCVVRKDYTLMLYKGWPRTCITVATMQGGWRIFPKNTSYKNTHRIFMFLWDDMIRQFGGR